MTVGEQYTTGDIGLLQTAAKVAGFMFLFSLLVPALNFAFVLSPFVVADDPIGTARNIQANEALFRVGLTIELIMSVGLVVLAVALYRIFKSISGGLALLALLWKMAEAVLAAAIVLISFVALHVANGTVELTAFSPEQLLAPVGLLLNAHTVLYSVPMVFLGLDLMLFFYLFYRSNYIPRIMAGFGVLSYALIFIHALGIIVVPDVATMSIVQAVAYLPSCGAELVVGIWLLAKGLNMPSPDVNVSGSVAADRTETGNA
jgi:hypothetical protein